MIAFKFTGWRGYVLILIILFALSYKALAQEVSIFDIPAEPQKAIVEVQCKNKQFQLVIKKEDLDNKVEDIKTWFDQIVIKCREE